MNKRKVRHLIKQSQEKQTSIHFLGFEIEKYDKVFDTNHGFGLITKINEDVFDFEVSFQGAMMPIIESYDEYGIKPEDVDSEKQTLFWRNPKKCKTTKLACTPLKKLNKKQLLTY